MTLRPSDFEERRRRARRWRQRQREAARRYEERVKEEVLDGEREWNSVPDKNPERRKKEWPRAYGSEERVRWVASLPCLACGSAPSENAHVETGGTGRKADADKVVPLCGTEPGREGCHARLHRVGIETFQAETGLDLHAEARRIEAAWQRRQGHDD